MAGHLPGTTVWAVLKHTPENFRAQLTDFTALVQGQALSVQLYHCERPTVNCDPAKSSRYDLRSALADYTRCCPLQGGGVYRADVRTVIAATNFFGRTNSWTCSQLTHLLCRSLNASLCRDCDVPSMFHAQHVWPATARPIPDNFLTNSSRHDSECCTRRREISFTLMSLVHMGVSFSLNQRQLAIHLHKIQIHRCHITTLFAFSMAGPCRTSDLRVPQAPSWQVNCAAFTSAKRISQLRGLPGTACTTACVAGPFVSNRAASIDTEVYSHTLASLRLDLQRMRSRCTPSEPIEQNLAGDAVVPPDLCVSHSWRHNRVHGQWCGLCVSLEAPFGTVCVLLERAAVVHSDGARHASLSSVTRWPCGSACLHQADFRLADQVVGGTLSVSTGAIWI